MSPNWVKQIQLWILVVQKYEAIFQFMFCACTVEVGSKWVTIEDIGLWIYIKSSLILLLDWLSIDGEMIESTIFQVLFLF